MKTIYSAPRGTNDILPEDYEIWQYVIDIAIKTSEKFGFLRIQTPTFENIELFKRSVGDSTDIVQKEMFAFKDSKGRQLALRPEGTAAVVRATIQHGLLNSSLPLKIFYIMNFFRNERPQTGRYKEFYQFGVELFGARSAIAEFEIISLAYSFFNELNIKNLSLYINSIGCQNCRKNYIYSLTKYFESYKEKICENCKNRLYNNPLRLLDCKEEQCEKFKLNAPNILDYICADCKTHFNTLCNFLNLNNIPYVVNQYIVRGLDYYTRTVFEFVTNNLGAQNAVCGGGRYDNLIEKLGAPSTPAVGFGVGLNRLILLLKNQININSKTPHIYIGATDEESLYKVSTIATNLRARNILTQIDLMNRSVKSQMKYANKIKAKFSCIIGNNELTNNSVNVKNMNSEENFNISLQRFAEEFEKILKT